METFSVLLAHCAGNSPITSVLGISHWHLPSIRRALMIHWNENVVILKEFSSLAALKVVKMAVHPVAKILSKWHHFRFSAGDRDQNVCWSLDENEAKTPGAMGAEQRHPLCDLVCKQLPRPVWDDYVKKMDKLFHRKEIHPHFNFGNFLK